MAVATPSIAPVTACVEITEICFIEGIRWMILGGIFSASFAQPSVCIRYGSWWRIRDSVVSVNAILERGSFARK
jgi:hypothetical protein